MDKSKKIEERQSRRKCKWMSVDPIELILLLLGRVFRNHIFLYRCTSIATVAYLELFNVICIVQGLTNKRWYFRQYTTTIILQQPGCCGLIFLSYYIKDIVKFPEVIFGNCWAPNSCGVLAEKKIIRDSKICLSSCLGQTLLCMVVHLIFLPIVGDEENIFFAVLFFNEHFGQWAKVPKFVFYVCIGVLGYGTLLALYGCMYISYHIRFQLYLLNEYTKAIRIKDVENVDQEAIYEEIIILVSHHVRVKQVAKVLFTVQNTPLLMYHIYGAIGGASGLYFILTNVSPSSNFRMICAAFAGVSISLSAAICSQSLIDESNELFLNITNTPWIHMDERNKKGILMLLVNSLNPIRLTCFGLIDINYNFLLFLVRVIYSLIAVVTKFK